MLSIVREKDGAFSSDERSSYSKETYDTSLTKEFVQWFLLRGSRDNFGSLKSDVWSNESNRIKFRISEFLEIE